MVSYLDCSFFRVRGVAETHRGENLVDPTGLLVITLSDTSRALPCFVHISENPIMHSHGSRFLGGGAWGQ